MQVLVSIRSAGLVDLILRTRLFLAEPQRLLVIVRFGLGRGGTNEAILLMQLLTPFSLQALLIM